MPPFRKPMGFGPRPPRPRRDRNAPTAKQLFRQSFVINDRITVPEVRVVDDSGQVGIMSTQAALDMARAQELDLVLVAAGAKPPIARIVEFSKFLYNEEKKLANQKKGAQKSIVKDIKISLFAGKGDIERFVGKAKEFLSEGNQVRINLTLKGRQMEKKEMAMQKMNEFLAAVPEGVPNKEPRLEGRVVRVVISRKH